MDLEKQFAKLVSAQVDIAVGKDVAPAVAAALDEKIAEDPRESLLRHAKGKLAGVRDFIWILPHAGTDAVAVAIKQCNAFTSGFQGKCTASHRVLYFDVLQRMEKDQRPCVTPPLLDKHCVHRVNVLFTLAQLGAVNRNGQTMVAI